MQWIICLSIGTLSGIISGLFGAAGGWFLVPALILGLPFTGVHGPELIKIAIATALTINVFTSFSTARAYAERGCVHWRALYFMLPGTAVGVIAGAMLAARADVTVVTVIFVAGALYMAWKMTRNPANGHAHHLDALPGFFNLSAKGVAVGGLVGAVGGGGLSVPIFLHYMTIHQAIGTASVLTIPISAMAVSTFAIAHAPQGCEGACVGYVHMPAVCATGIAAVLFAPAGCRACAQPARTDTQACLRRHPRARRPKSRPQIAPLCAHAGARGQRGSRGNPARLPPLPEPRAPRSGQRQGFSLKSPREIPVTALAAAS